MRISNVRRAAPADARAIWEINSRSLGYDFPADKTRARFLRILGQDDHAFFVFGSPVVGYVQIADYDCTYAEPLADLIILGVLPEAQGMGAGRALMEAAEDWAKARGIVGVRLDSGMDRTGAHAFYQAIGYRLRKDHRNFVKSFSDG